jgi:hypothetical protein
MRNPGVSESLSDLSAHQRQKPLTQYHQIAHG